MSTAKQTATWKAQQQRAAATAAERRDLARLRAELRRAKAERSQRARRVRADIRRGRTRLAAAMRAFRKEWREYVSAMVARRRAEARAAWQVKLAKALAQPTKRVAAKSAALSDYRRELAQIRRYASDQRKPSAVRKAFERKAESDDRVRGNLPPELHRVWRKYKGKIKTRSGKKTRTETFLEWCAENPQSVLRAQWGDDDQARLEKELREAEAAAARAKRAGATPRDLDLLAAM